ncbi:MAG: SfnB family sulfur acquisition oxidoreductase [Gammaproteobacteria bacterium]|nr:SfnB family sulfur acquisition oxidoreductase [Gammaproteobacteria bacterium]
MAPVPRIDAPAHRIRDEQEALELAHRLAEKFAAQSAQRDRERRLPFAEIDEFSQSGLWGISVPREYGGAGASYATLAEVMAIVSAGDASIGQIPQNHFYMVEAIRLDGSEEQKRYFFEAVLRGDRFGNAFTEVGTKTILDLKTRIEREGDRYRLNGKKFYSTGAIFSHWVPTVAFNENDQFVIAFAPRDANGVTVIDDWTCFGQRTTASGSVYLDDVELTDLEIIVHQAAFDRPTPMGPVAQILHAAIDTGIARAALADTIDFVRKYTRPWIDSGQDHGYEDPYIIYMVGDLEIKVHAADAMLERAGHIIDEAAANPNEETVAAASVAVAESKAYSTEVSLLATNKLFELAGTRATLEEYNLNRHWRNARAHTVHDPVRWKYQAIGNFWLNGVYPPRHGAI